MDKQLGRVLLQAVIACAAMVIVLLILAPSSEFWLNATIWARIGWLGLLIASGMGTYFLILVLAGVRPPTLARSSVESRNGNHSRIAQHPGTAPGMC